MPAVSSGTVRLTQIVRCGQTRLTTLVRGLVPGLYRLAIDDTPVVEFYVDASGHARSLLNGVDPRGHTVTLIDDSGRSLFRSAVPMAPAPPVHMRAELKSTNRQPGDSGLVTYERHAGVERFVVVLRGLRAGGYQLFAGSQLVSGIDVDKDGDAAILRFDTRGISGPPPSVALPCQTLQVRRSGVVLLQLTATQPGSGICPAV
ncbi:MAG TPA: hypothetical protein VL403_01290 [Candidatus Kryptonia bacterium]|nr:hypothetical protein [Candidatus Kryptonia bacterium]